MWRTLSLLTLILYAGIVKFNIFFSFKVIIWQSQFFFIRDVQRTQRSQYDSTNYNSFFSILVNSIGCAACACCAPLRKKITFQYNNFKTKKDINIRSFFPKKYYSSQALYVKYICLSVIKKV